MDNLTHTLTGLFLARAGLNRLAPDAAWIIVIAANAPDVDVISGLAGPAVALHWHRHFTHGVAFSPILALLIVAAWRIVMQRRNPWLTAVLAAWLSVLSHLLLDLTNSYGIRLLAPFSGHWFYWDLNYIIDPWIWSVLLLALFAPLIGRLVSSEMGRQMASPYPGRAWPVVALGFFLAYDATRALLHNRAITTLNDRIYAGEVPRRVAAMPTALNPMVWQALAETSDRYFLYELNLGSEFRPESGKFFFKNDPGGTVVTLGQLPQFHSLIEFARFPLWRGTNDENNARYSMTDLRFGDPTAGTFTCSARLVNAKQAVDERCDFTFAPSF